MAKVLCVGHDRSLLGLRCAILRSDGHTARMASVEEAESVLGEDKFALVILSAIMSTNERRQLLIFASGTPVIALDGVTLPRELLDTVSHVLHGPM